MPSVEDYRKELARRLVEAEQRGELELTVSAGEIGAVPVPNRMMTRCIQALRAAMVDGDRIVQMNSKDAKADLTISYVLPRK